MDKELFAKKNIYGVMGTIIIHLIVAIVFLLVKLSSDFKSLDDGILIDLASLQEELADLQKEVEQADNNKDMAFDDFHDIAVNEASQPDVKFDINEYIDGVKEEMIAKGELTEDNFIDRAKEAQNAEGDLQYLEEKTDVDESQDEKTIAKMESDYRGPTRISYFLKDRFKVKLPIPIYTCPDGGSVTVEITVDPYGKVIEAVVKAVESNTDDYCLREAALSAAKKSRFTSGEHFPSKQKGTITYIFTSQ